MKKIVIIFAVFVFFMSCEKHKDTYNCDKPLEDLQWLNNLKSSFTNCTCQVSIFQATYNNQTVFYEALTDPLCYGNYAFEIKDCDGNIVKTYEPGSDGNFANEVTNRKIIYTCKSK